MLCQLFTVISNMPFNRYLLVNNASIVNQVANFHFKRLKLIHELILL